MRQTAATTAATTAAPRSTSPAFMSVPPQASPSSSARPRTEPRRTHRFQTPPRSMKPRPANARAPATRKVIVPSRRRRRSIDGPCVPPCPNSAPHAPDPALWDAFRTYRRRRSSRCTASISASTPWVVAKHRGCQCCAGSERRSSKNGSHHGSVRGDIVTPGPAGSIASPQPSQFSFAPTRTTTTLCSMSDSEPAL